jgi:predicted HicB family RNase H-like nuclease
MANPSDKYGYQVAWSERNALFVAYCAELPGIAAHGDTADEALHEARVAAGASVALLKEAGDPVPEPLCGFSGKLSLRITPELHRSLALQATTQRVSLNRYLSAKLGR